MTISRTINKQLAGREDLLLGSGTQTQTRGGVDVSISRINALSIPYYPNGSAVSTPVGTTLDRLDGIDGIDSLRALTPIGGETYWLNYHTTEGDGGGGKFRAYTGESAGTYTDDNGVTILPTGDGSAAWVREYSGPVDVRWFGAVGDGVTDDTAAIQAALNSVNGNRGGRVLLGPYQYRYSTLTISQPVQLCGTSARTSLVTDNPTSDKITVTTPQQVIFSDLSLESSVTQTGGAYVKIVTDTFQNFRSIFDNVSFNSPYVGINAETVNGLKLNRCYFASYKNTGVIIKNDIVNDSGDHSFIGNTWDAGAESSVAIKQINSGGAKIVGNKFLSGTYHYLGSFDQTGVGAQNTSVLVFNDNSSENCSVANVAFNATSPTIFKYVVISGNQFTLGGSTAISLDDPGYRFIDSMDISNNVFNLGGTTPKGISLAQCRDVIIGPNVFIGNSTSETGVVIASSVDKVLVSKQLFRSVDNEWAIDGSATNIEFNASDYETGSFSGTTSIAYGTLYTTSTITVTFAKEYPIIPEITVTPNRTGGIVGHAISDVSRTQFLVQLYGVTNGGSVSANWSASLSTQT